MNLTKNELKEFEKKLKEKGYVKYLEDYKSEDYVYWKLFQVDKDSDGETVIGYQIGFLIYDFTKYNKEYSPKISIGYEMIIMHDKNIGRVSLSISDDKITAEGFETMCKEFYDFWKERKVNN